MDRPVPYSVYLRAVRGAVRGQRWYGIAQWIFDNTPIRPVYDESRACLIVPTLRPGAADAADHELRYRSSQGGPELECTCQGFRSARHCWAWGLCQLDLGGSLKEFATGDKRTAA